MKIITRTYPSIPETREAEYAFIDITPELVALIMKRGALWDELRLKDERLAVLLFTDYAPEFWDVVEDLSEEQEGEIADNGWTYADDSSVGIGEKCRTDLDQMCINGTGVYWTASVKNSDVIVETAWIDLSELSDIAERGVRRCMDQS